MRFWLWLMTLSTTALATPGVAQGMDARRCELHVWPGDGLKSVYFGWFHGGTVDGQLQGRSGYPQLPRDPIATARQAELIEAAAPHTLLGRPDDQLIVHREALDSRTIRTMPGRLSDSSVPCYGELVVDDIVFRQDVIAGTVLMTLYRYRRFDAGPAADYRFANWTKASLKLLPLRPGGDLDAAIAELEGAYVADLKSFAELVLKQAKKKH